MNSIISLLNEIFLIALLVAFALLYANLKAKPAKRGKDRHKVYTGGEDISINKLQVSAGSYAWPVKKAFGGFYKTIGDRHAGKISDYLGWVLLAVVLFVLLLVGVMI